MELVLALSFLTINIILWIFSAIYIVIDSIIFGKLEKVKTSELEKEKIDEKFSKIGKEFINKRNERIIFVGYLNRYATYDYYDINHLIKKFIEENLPGAKIVPSLYKNIFMYKDRLYDIYTIEYNDEDMQVEDVEIKIYGIEEKNY